MRVLFWTSSFSPSVGGVQRLAADLLPALEQRGYRHLVVAPHSDDDESTLDHYGDIPVHRISVRNAWTVVDRLAQVRRQVAELKRGFGPDLIHIFALNDSNFFHHLTAHVFPAPLLISLHGRWPLSAERTLKHAAWVTACSQALLRMGQELVPEIVPRSSVIYNGRKQPPFEARPLIPDPPLLVCIGRLAPEKAFDRAIAAFSYLHDRFPNARMIIAGDGSEKANLSRQIDQLGLNERIELRGWVSEDETFRLFDRATLVIIPSRREGFSLVAVEAAFMARPVVGTRVGGLPEVVVHGKTGLLVDSDDSDALANAISFLLNHPATAIQMGEEGRTRVRRKFGWERYVDDYDALYQKVTLKNDFRTPE